MSCVWNVEVDTAPAEEPLTATEAKAHLRVDNTDDDTYITSLITAARVHVENWLGKKLITQVLILHLDQFPQSAREIVLPYGPVQTVDSIAYLDSSGATATFTTFREAIGEISRVVPTYGNVWPPTQPVIDAVQIEYTTGYGDADDVPKTIKQAMLLLIGNWYANREQVVVGTIVAELPQAVTALLSAERVDWL